MDSQKSCILVLEDNEERMIGFAKALQAIDPSLQMIHWRSAKQMIAEVDAYLSKARLISLDHDLYPTAGETEDPGDGLEVAKYLATKHPVCPIIIHSSNAYRAAAMAGEFELGGCDAKQVAPLGADWIEAHWAKIVLELLQKRASNQG